MEALPGAELISDGLAALHAGEESESALLVALAAPRLRGLGVDVPAGAEDGAAHRLYARLSERHEDPHSRYNALIRRVVSYAHAVESASSR